MRGLKQARNLQAERREEGGGRREEEIGQKSEHNIRGRMFEKQHCSYLLFVFLSYVCVVDSP